MDYKSEYLTLNVRTMNVANRLAHDLKETTTNETKIETFKHFYWADSNEWDLSNYN